MPRKIFPDDTPEPPRSQTNCDEQPGLVSARKASLCHSLTLPRPPWALPPWLALPHPEGGISPAPPTSFHDLGRKAGLWELRGCSGGWSPSLVSLYWIGWWTFAGLWFPSLPAPTGAFAPRHWALSVGVVLGLSIKVAVFFRPARGVALTPGVLNHGERPPEVIHHSGGNQAERRVFPPPHPELLWHSLSSILWLSLPILGAT